MRAVLLRSAYDLFVAVEGRPTEPVEIVINDYRGLAIAIRSMPNEFEEIPQILPELGDMERRLLNVATAEPIPAKQLTRLAGYRSLGHVYSALRHLCHLKLLVKSPRGYHLPN